MLLFSGVSSISPCLSQSAVPRAEASAPAEASLMPTGVEEQDNLYNPVGCWAFVQGCDGVYSVCCLLPLQLFLVNLLPYSHPSSHLSDYSWWGEAGTFLRSCLPYYLRQIHPFGWSQSWPLDYMDNLSTHSTACKFSKCMSYSLTKEKTSDHQTKAWRTLDTHLCSRSG